MQRSGLNLLHFIGLFHPAGGEQLLLLAESLRDLPPFSWLLKWDRTEEVGAWGGGGQQILNNALCHEKKETKRRPDLFSGRNLGAWKPLPLSAYPVKNQQA